MSEHGRIPASIRNVSFPVARRGYEPRAVDAYVTQINRLIAELEATHSPRDAVAHALERTEEERSAILTEAHERGAEMVAAAQEQAEELTATARAEAADIDGLGKLIVAKVQAVPGVTRTLTCPVVHL